MSLLVDILVDILSKESISVSFPDLHVDVNEIIEMQCYKALHKIKAIIQDDSLSDEECFMRIEEIICIFEAIGSRDNSRHDC